MESLLESAQDRAPEIHGRIPVTVIIPTRNEVRNLVRCLDSVREMAEVYVVDSQSTDGTQELARTNGAKLIQFRYRGGWPKKRQWALDTLPIQHEWVLLLDADEVVTPELADEIREEVACGRADGLYIALDMYFLGRRLRHGDAAFWKLSLFRRERGRFECRLREQDQSMADMEVHEHVIVQGATGKLKHRLIHHNVNSLSDYIQKHNEYSNWESEVWAGPGTADELLIKFWGTQAQRRRFLKKWFLRVPGSPLFFFLYRYVLHFGFLDGIPGLIYCCFQAIQIFHVKAKLYESRVRKANSRTCAESAA